VKESHCGGHGTLLARHFFASRSAHVAPAWGSLAKWIIKLKYSWRAHHVDVSKRTWAGIEEYQSEDSNYLLFTRVSLKLLSRGVRSRTIKSLQTRYFHQSRFVQSNKKKICYLWEYNGWRMSRATCVYKETYAVQHGFVFRHLLGLRSANYDAALLSQFCRKSGWVTANDNIIIIIASVTVQLAESREAHPRHPESHGRPARRAVGCGRNNHFTSSEQITVHASTYLTFKMQNGWFKWHSSWCSNQLWIN